MKPDLVNKAQQQEYGHCVARDLEQCDRQNMNGYMLSGRFVRKQARALGYYHQRLTPI